MAKRSREDFDSPSPESAVSGDLSTTAISGIYNNRTNTSLSTSKIIHLDSGSGEAHPIAEMRCSLPPHRQIITFTSFEEYDVHYAKTHTNRCVECRKNFPTEHFLNLHIEENHDSLVSVRRERGEKTYSCFVEDCDRKCSTPQKRRMHLIDKHMFPKEYDFYVVNDGVDKRTSMLRSGKHRRRSSTQHRMNEVEERSRRRASTLETIDPKVDKEHEETMSFNDPVILTPSISQDDEVMEGLSGAMSALKFVPSSVRFGGRGRGRGRGGFSRA